jgi:hypothetical protein
MKHNLKKATGLQSLLNSVIEDLHNEKVDVNKAKVFSQIAGTKIAGYRVELAYKKLTGKPLTIDFFE